MMSNREREELSTAADRIENNVNVKGQSSLQSDSSPLNEIPSINQPVAKENTVRKFKRVCVLCTFNHLFMYFMKTIQSLLNAIKFNYSCGFL